MFLAVFRRCTSRQTRVVVPEMFGLTCGVGAHISCYAHDTRLYPIPIEAYRGSPAAKQELFAIVRLSPAYILATMPVYDPTELSRANRVATVQRSLRRLNHVHCHDPIHRGLPSDSLEAAGVYAPWCHLVFRQASVTTAVVIG